MRVQTITEPVFRTACNVAITIAQVALKVYQATKAFFASFVGLFISFALLDMLVPQGWKIAAQTTFAYGYTAFKDWRCQRNIHQLQTHLAGQTERNDRQQALLKKSQEENQLLHQLVAAQRILQEATQIVAQTPSFDIWKMAHTLSEKEAQALITQFNIGVVV